MNSRYIRFGWIGTERSRFVRIWIRNSNIPIRYGLNINILKSRYYKNNYYFYLLLMFFIMQIASVLRFINLLTLHLFSLYPTTTPVFSIFRCLLPRKSGMILPLFTSLFILLFQPSAFIANKEEFMLLKSGLPLLIIIPKAPFKLALIQ